MYGRADHPCRGVLGRRGPTGPCCAPRTSQTLGYLPGTHWFTYFPTAFPGGSVVKKKSDKSKVTQPPGCPHRAQPNEDAGLAGPGAPSPGLHSDGTGLCLPEGGRASLGTQCKDTMAGAQQQCSERNLAEPAHPGQGSQRPETPLGSPTLRE